MKTFLFLSFFFFLIFEIIVRKHLLQIVYTIYAHVPFLTRRVPKNNHTERVTLVVMAPREPENLERLPHVIQCQSRFTGGL